MQQAEVVLDQDDCRVYIVRSWHQGASELCEKLRTEIPWEQHEVVVGGRKSKEKRRSYSCGDEGVVHNYSGNTRVLHPWIPEISDVRDCLKEVGKFNSCIINEYSSGSDYICYHSDRNLVSEQIVSLSLGGSRDFCFKEKTTGKVIKTTLHNGDLCLILGRTNELYQHSIPKRAHADYRISVTYRFV